MTSRESARHSLYARLEELLGHENADTLMMSLPTQGTQYLATRLDTDRLEGRLDHLESKLDRLESKLDQQIRTYTVTTVGAMTGLTAIFGVIVTLLA